MRLFCLYYILPMTRVDFLASEAESITCQPSDPVREWPLPGFDLQPSTCKHRPTFIFRLCFIHLSRTRTDTEHKDLAHISIDPSSIHWRQLKQRSQVSFFHPHSVAQHDIYYQMEVPKVSPLGAILLASKSATLTAFFSAKERWLFSALLLNTHVQHPCLKGNTDTLWSGLKYHCVYYGPTIHASDEEVFEVSDTFFVQGLLSSHVVAYQKYLFSSLTFASMTFISTCWGHAVFLTVSEDSLCMDFPKHEEIKCWWHLDFTTIAHKYRPNTCFCSWPDQSEQIGLIGRRARRERSKKRTF